MKKKRIFALLMTVIMLFMSVCFSFSSSSAEETEPVAGISEDTEVSETATSEESETTADAEMQETDENITETSPAEEFVMLPAGTITIQETLAPTGYELNPEVFVRKIEPGTNAAVSTYNIPTSIERPTRGDFSFTKLDADTDAPLANVKFTITSPSGEERTVWTDENGVYSTASSFIPHSSDTNAGTPDAGIWFGSGAVDDDLGACPFGTYTIKEQRCDANKNHYKDLAAFTVTVAQEGTTVNIGDVYNYPFPTVQTVAWDTSTKTNLAALGDKIYITDTCYLNNLEVGHGKTKIGNPKDVHRYIRIQ